MTIKDKLYHFIFMSDLHATRIILSISEFIWGMSLLLPGDTFSRSKTYSGMAAIFSESTWGIIWLISGVIQTIILYKDDYHSTPAISFAAVNSILWWFVIVSLYANVYPVNSVASADAALAIASTWIWIRSGWDAAPRGV